MYTYICICRYICLHINVFFNIHMLLFSCARVLFYHIYITAVFWYIKICIIIYILVCVYVHTYIYTYTHTHIPSTVVSSSPEVRTSNSYQHKHTHAYTHTYIFSYTHTQTQKQTQTHTHTHTHSLLLSLCLSLSNIHTHTHCAGLVIAKGFGDEIEVFLLFLNFGGDRILLTHFGILWIVTRFVFSQQENTHMQACTWWWRPIGCLIF